MTLGILYGVVLGILFFSNTQYYLINKRIYSVMEEDNCSYKDAVSKLELGFPYSIILGKAYGDSQLRKKLVRVRVVLGYVLCVLLIVLYIILRLSKYATYLEIEL